MPLTDFADDVIKKMYELELIEEVVKVFPERRESNKSIPIEAILVLAISAKLQRLRALTDIPTATLDVDILNKIGYQMKMENDSLFSEGEIRAFLKKYTPEELIEYYNEIAQKVIKKMDYNRIPQIHQLDSTEIDVNFTNENYEEATITRGKERKIYKRI